MKKFKYHILLLAALLVGLVVAEYYAPREIDWRPTFERTDKIPYGTYVIYKLLPDIFPNSEIADNDKSLYSADNMDYSGNTNYLFITNSFAPDKPGISTLLDVVAEGNNVFIAANEIGKPLLDTLKISQRKSYFYWEQDTITSNFVSPSLKSDSAYVFDKTMADVTFEQPHGAATILGRDNDGNIDFLRFSYGEGFLYINSRAIAFTNYSMLKNINETNEYGNSAYAIKALSYLPDARKLLWDEYYKPFSVHNSGSPLQYIINQPSLYASYLVLVVGFFVFMYFEGKRRQRAIPIVVPPKNTSLEFVSTVGSLYFQTGKHNDLAAKKFLYFADYLRSHYYINAFEANSPEEFEHIAKNTGVKVATVQRVFAMYQSLKDQNSINSDALKHFNDAIEAFYAECK